MPDAAHLIATSRTGNFYRAIPQHRWATALQTAHTRLIPSRFSEGTNQFEILYLAEDSLVALFEVEALLGSPFRGWVAAPHPPWTIINVTVNLQQVADLTSNLAQGMVLTTAQELTGDWHGNKFRTPYSSVKQPTGAAPTQEFGAALFQLRRFEGFLTVSAEVPTQLNLVVFPERMLKGSLIEFHDPATGSSYKIKGEFTV